MNGWEETDLFYETNPEVAKKLLKEKPLHELLDICRQDTELQNDLLGLGVAIEEVSVILAYDEKEAPVLVHEGIHTEIKVLMGKDGNEYGIIGVMKP